MAKQLNGQAEDRDEDRDEDREDDEGMNFEEFIKSMDSMEPEEVRAAFNDLIETLEADGEPVPFFIADAGIRGFVWPDRNAIRACICHWRVRAIDVNRLYQPGRYYGSWER